jgi:hypothetical protein
MSRRKPIQPLSVITSRWRAWATQLAQRHGRMTDVSRLHLLLRMPALARTLIMLQQRWLATNFNIQPQLNLLLSNSNAWDARTSNVYATQMTLLKSISMAMAGSRTAATAPGSPPTDLRLSSFEHRQRKAADTTSQSRPQSAMTLAIKRTAAEHLATTLNQSFYVRRGANFMEVSKLLTERLQRLSDTVASPSPPMAFRTSPAARLTPQHLPAEAMLQASTFEKRSSPGSLPALGIPALNVEQLTDQVLKQIDRRVIARRERMGQI